MDLIETARLYAKKAHEGQVRRLTNEPYFVHVEAVANLLKQEGFSAEVVAAGYLHDTVEDTDVSITDIEGAFGKKVAALVQFNTENKALSWEDRKKHTIDTLDGASLEERVLVAADKLDNISSLLSHQNKKDLWSAFKRGPEKQEWYYKNVALKLLSGEDEPQRLFLQLNEKVNELFSKHL
ncbi:HD domain-containing protein [Bacillus timonensis]|nr:HD domain-containing protein [Bacillus timonensis]